MGLKKYATLFEFWLDNFRMCHLENEPEEAHAMNQSILYNHGTPFLFSYLKKPTKIAIKKIT